MEESASKKHKKKHKHKKDKKTLDDTELQTDTCEKDRSLCRKKKKKEKTGEKVKSIDMEHEKAAMKNDRKHTKQVASDSTNREQPMDSPDEMISPHKSKKKKREKSKEACNNVHVSDISESEELVEDKDIYDDADKIKTNKKKKKKSRHSDESDHLDKETDFSSKKKKKHKKKEKQNANFEENIQESVTDEFVKKKKKKRKYEDEDNERHLDSLSKKKRTGENENVKTSEEKDTRKLDSSQNHDATVGQWKTASLGDEERQNKFLRLLGGFKKSGGSENDKPKGFFGNIGAKGGNYAMNQKEEEVYKANMEIQFEKAVSMKFQRGIGLGFEPPPDAGKKFYIDMNKSKSIKFDDD